MAHFLPHVIDRCVTAQGELQLQQRGGHFEVISNGTFLMSTENGISERQLVRRALSGTSFPRRVLIGGLGVGYSAAEALANEDVEQVTVVEIHPQIIEWQRRYFGNHSGDILDDPRTVIVCADLVDWIAQERTQYDAICLDIDNGPDWVVTEQNRSLYAEPALAQLAGILAPGGALTFWSASPAHRFAKQLGRLFQNVEEIAVDIGPREPDYVYVARGKRAFNS